MIPIEPSLIITRLIVQGKTKVFYDEKFKVGINIIRGENSSGKSTISDFIFYILGGDFNLWKPEARMASFVTAEIMVNKNILTLRRNITETKQQPMYVYFGPYEESVSSPFSDWKEFSFSRRPLKESFSQILFRALQFPEVKGDNENNITMHQVLRLLYVDQLSSVYSLIRNEDFDSPLTRETIAELLFGVYDDSLYSAQKELRDKQKSFNETKQKYDNIIAIFNKTDQEFDSDSLITKLKNAEQEQENILTKLSQVEEKRYSLNDIKRKSQLESLKNEITPVKQRYSELMQLADKLKLEIEDSKYFVDNLNKRHRAIQESIKAREFIQEFPIDFCPHCLARLEPINEKNKCSLCKAEISNESSVSAAFKMDMEIEFQLIESQNLLKDKEGRLNGIIHEIPIAHNTLNQLQQKYNREKDQVKSSRDGEYESLLERRGEIKGLIEQLTHQLNSAKIIKELETEWLRLKREIDALEIRISSKRKQQNSNLYSALSLISENTISLLRSDFAVEDTFQTGKELKLDFKKNIFTLDERNNFSASSIIYLKNSIHFGILFASVNLESFRYPRFILCDNIEDKGMQEKRSQNFQKAIVKLSKQSKFEHQIIFTTSMIDPELNNSEYCVGDFYTKDNKSLKIV